MFNERKVYLETEIKPIMEELTHKLATDRPENPTEYMLEFLKTLLNYSNAALSEDEKKELDDLRAKVQDLRLQELKQIPNLLDITDDDIDNINRKEKLNSNIQPLKNNNKNDTNNINKLDLNTQTTFNSNSKLLNGMKVASRKPRAGVSAEVYGKLNKREDFVPKSLKKTESQIERIKTKILTSFLFRNLEESDLDIIISAMEEKDYKTGDTVIKQGESGDCLFIVETGELRCEKVFAANSEATFLKNYSSGDSFGELALLYNTPRAATILALSDSILWSLDRQTFNYIIKDSARKKREKYEKFLRSVEILQTVDDYELCQICDALKIYHFKAGDYVIREGETGDKFYIIEEGQALATKTDEKGEPSFIKPYKKGDYFGELALLKGGPRAANVIAKTDLVLISLDRKSFKRLLGPIEEILLRNTEAYLKYVKK